MITVIIVNYFSAHLTIQTVQHLLSAPMSVALAVHVVDNSVCLQQQQALQALPAQVQLHFNKKNNGFGRACNQVYQATTGDWVLLLNPDAYLLPNALELLYQFLRQHPQVAAAAPKVFWDAEQRYFLPFNVAHSPWYSVTDGRQSEAFRRQAVAYWLAEKPLRQANLSGGHTLLRRAAVDAAGGLFDEQFFIYYEDEDLFLRLKRAGFDLYCVPAARAVHVFNGCARDKTAWKYQQAAVAEQQFFAKHYPRATWLDKTRDYWQRLQQKVTPSPVLAVKDLGLCERVPAFAVPEQWQAEWLIEFSLSPYFYPAVGFFGQGAEAEYPKNAAEILPLGRQYVRLAPVKMTGASPQLWSWELSCHSC